MSKALLSPEWTEEYGRLWNTTPETREGTADMSVVIRYRLAEDHDRVGEIEVDKGEVVYAGAARGGDKPDFLLTAKLDVWKQLADGELGAKKALTMQKLKFQGPMVVALNHLAAFQAALQMFGRVDDTAWN